MAQTKMSKVTGNMWIKNAAKSLGISTNNVMKDLAPGLHNVASTGVKSSSQLINGIKNGSVSSSNIKNIVKNNKFVKIADTTFKNALEDVKQGNFNNTSRSPFGDDDFSFGDGSGWDAEDSVQTSQLAAATLSVSTQIAKQSDMHVKTSKAMHDSMVALMSTSITHNQEIGAQVISQLANLNNGVNTLNNNFTKFMSASMGFYDVMNRSPIIGGSSSRSNSSKVYGSKGQLDLGNYKGYIKDNLKKTYDSSMIGMVTSLLGDGGMISSNGIGMLSEAVIKRIMPKMLASSLTLLESSFAGMTTTMLHQLAGMSNAPGLKGYAGKIFGVQNKRVSKINMANSIQKGAVPFDGITRTAITSVIPKELREQTQYLKIIASHFAGGNSRNVGKSVNVFDYNTGTYKDSGRVRNEMLENLTQSTINTMMNGSFGKNLKSVITANSGKNAKDIESMNNVLENFMLTLLKNGKAVNFTKTGAGTDTEKVFKELNATKREKELLLNAIQVLINNKKGGLDISNTIHKGTETWNSEMERISSNPMALDVGLSQADFDKLTKEFMKKKSSKVKRGVSSDYLSSTSIKNIPSTWDTKSGNVTNRLTSAMYAITYGNMSQAMNEFSGMFSDSVVNIGKKINETFISGRKGDNGYKSGGILSGLLNSMTDASNMFKHSLTGKGYKDSTGVEHKDDTSGKTVLGMVKSAFSTIKSSTLDVIFGEKNEDGKRTKLAKGAGIVGGAVNTIKTGFNDFANSFFGTEGINAKDYLASAKKRLQSAMPNMITGGLAGLGVGIASGGILGSLIGGPIGGALIGSTIGFATKSEKFQNWLFGKEELDKDGQKTGQRLGGFVSKKLQDTFKKNKSSIIGGATLGTVKSMVFGSGVLGSLVGGPIAGAIFGITGSLIKKSDTFQRFLYGDSDKGFEGVSQAFNKLFKKKGTDDVSGKKLAGMSGAGVIGGALTGALIAKVGLLGAVMSPLGPIGGSIAGLALAIKAQKSSIHEWLHGKNKVDSNGKVIGKEKHGILGQFANMLKVELVNPMKTQAKNLYGSMKEILEYKILDPARLAILPIGSMLKIKMETTFDKVGEHVKNLFKPVTDPIVDLVKKSLISPLRKSFSFLIKGLNAVGGTILKAPGVALDGISSLADRGARKASRKRSIWDTQKEINQINKRIKSGNISDDELSELQSRKSSLVELKSGIKNRFSEVAKKAESNYYDVDAAQSNREERKRRNAEYTDARKTRLATFADEKDTNYNRSLIAKLTGNQKVLDTEENRILAQQNYEAQRKEKSALGRLVSKKTLDFKGAARDVDAAVVTAVTSLDVSKQQLSSLKNIENIVSNKLGGKKSFKNSVSNQNKEVSKAKISQERNENSMETTIAERAAEDEKMKNESVFSKMTGLLRHIRDDASSHNQVWSSIFSKKGLITGSLLLASPLIIKFLSSVDWSSLMSSLGSVASLLGGGTSSNKDGDSAMGRVGANLSNTAGAIGTTMRGNIPGGIGQFVTNEDGELDHSSYAKAKFLNNKLVVKPVKKFKNIKEGVSTFVKGTKTSKGFNLAKTVSKKGANTLSKGAKKLTNTKLATTVIENGGKMKTKVAGFIDEFFSGIIKTLKKKFPALAADTISAFKTKLISNLPKILLKASKALGSLFGATAALASTVVGLAAKEVTWIVLGAIGGATGAKQLFQTDDVDGVMIAISTAMGAFAGTTPGSVMDILNEFATDILGVDLFSEVAVLLYSGIMNMLGKTKSVTKLKDGRAAFKDKYEKYKSSAIEDAYADYLTANSLSSSDLSLDEFKKKVDSGEAKVSIKSFADYNDEQHKNIFGKIGSGIKKGATFVKNSVKKTFENGKTVINAMTNVAKSIKKNGIAGTLDKFFAPTKTTAYFDTYGAYYVLGEGDTFNYYNINNDLVGKGIPKDDVFQRLAAGLLTEGTVNKENTAKAAVKLVASSAKKIWTSASNTIADAWKSFWNTGDTKSKTSSPNTTPATTQTGGRGIVNGVPYFSQNDPRWKNQNYSGRNDKSTFGESGCGPTAMAMIGSKLTGKNVSPISLGNFASANGYRDNTGTNWNFVNGASSKLGLQSNMIQFPGRGAIDESLSKGQPVLLSGTSRSNNDPTSPYTTGGHYVVATGKDSKGNIMINDPLSRERSGKYPASSVAAGTGAAWVFSKGGKGRFRTIRGGRGTDEATLNKARAAVVSWMLAIQGKNDYSQDQRNRVELGLTGRGSGDCSSTVQWAYKKALNIDPGSTTRSQIISANGMDVDTSSSPQLNNLQIGDLLFFSKENSDTVGHVEMYAGNGQLIGHGSGIGPKIKTISNYMAYIKKAKKKYLKTRRWIHENANITAINAANASTVVNSQSSDAIVSSDSTNSSSGFDIFGKIASFIGEASSRLMTGFSTGKFDSDYSSFWKGESETGESTDGSATVGTTYGTSSSNSAINQSNNGVHKKISRRDPVTATQINQYIASLGKKDSILSNQGQAFIDAQNKTGISAIDMLAHAAVESAWGTSNIAKTKYNLFGWNAVDSNPNQATKFESVADSVNTVYGSISKNYVQKRKQDTYYKMLDPTGEYGYRYASDNDWANSIANTRDSIIAGVKKFGYSGGGNGIKNPVNGGRGTIVDFTSAGKANTNEIATTANSISKINMKSSSPTIVKELMRTIALLLEQISRNTANTYKETASVNKNVYSCMTSLEDIKTNVRLTANYEKVCATGTSQIYSELVAIRGGVASMKSSAASSSSGTIGSSNKATAVAIAAG